MEQHERQVVVDQLSASRDRLLSLTEGLSPQQWSFHPAEGSWSIGDCLEHVTRVETRVVGLIQKKLEEAPEPEKQDSAHSKDGLLAQVMPDRTERRKAPEHVQPTGEWSDPQELVRQFVAVRERTSEFASTTGKDLRSHFIPHMAFGELDCYQWLLVLAFHGERHARQIEEIKQTLPAPT